MALTIEIDHAKTRARAAAATGHPVVPQAVNRRVGRTKWGILLLTLSIYYVSPLHPLGSRSQSPQHDIVVAASDINLYDELIEQEPELERLFASCTITPEALKKVTAVIVMTQGELRETHLKYCLSTAPRFWASPAICELERYETQPAGKHHH